MHEDRLVSADDLVLQKDIVERLGINPSRLSNLAAGRRRSLGFPRPVAGRGTRGIWLWSEVEAWWDTTKTDSVAYQQAAGEGHVRGLRPDVHRKKRAA